MSLSGGGYTVYAISEDENVQKVNYGLIVVRFQDTEDTVTDAFFEKLSKTYNTSPESVNEYFSIVSKGKYSVSATLCSSEVIALNKNQSYYEPMYYYGATKEYVFVNEGGYDNRFFGEDGEPCDSSKSGAKQHIGRLLREQELIKDVVSAVRQNGFDASLDLNGDGKVDGLNIVLLTSGKENWNDILWAHRGVFTVYNEEAIKKEYYLPEDFSLSVLDFIPAYLGGSVVENYITIPASTFLNNQITDSNGDGIFSCGTVVHELMHDLGLADYYAYDGGEKYPSVGEFDIMGGGELFPSMPLAYTRQKLGWVDDDEVLPINKSGTYTVYPTSSAKSGTAYKLVLSDYADTGEYFMIEARSNSGSFIDKSLPGSGIIVYRVNEKNGYIGSDGQISSKYYGNVYGENEVYLYRLGNTSLSDKGFSYALLSGENTKKYNYDNKAWVDDSTIGNPDKSADKSVIDEKSNYLTTSIFYSNGKNSGVVITEITLADDGGYSFKIDFDDEDSGASGVNMQSYYDGTKTLISWTGCVRNDKVKVYTCPYGSVTKYKNGAYVLKKKINTDDFDKDNFSGGFSLVGETFSCYQNVVIPKTDESVAVFLFFEGEQGCRAEYVGVLNPQNPSFSEYLFGTTKWVALIIGIVVFFAALIIVVIAIMVYKEKKKSSAKAKKDQEEEELHLLEEEYGDAYWMNDESKEDDVLAENTDGDIEGNTKSAPEGKDENSKETVCENGTAIGDDFDAN